MHLSEQQWAAAYEDFFEVNPSCAFHSLCPTPPPRAHTRLHTGLTLWAAAQAFKNYDESGSPRRLNCLKTLVLANMLMKSKVDPFDAQEVGAPCLARMNHAGPVLGWCLPSK